MIDRVIASEVAILRYGLFSWREKETAGFTVHKRNDWATVVACIVVAIVAESIGVHLLVQHWSTRIAWLITALDLYAIVWLFGDYHALRLRPITIEDGVLHLRYGLRWNVEVPIENIREIKAAASRRTPRTLRVAMLDEPRRLNEPERFEAALRLGMG